MFTLAGQALGAPISQDGNVEGIRILSAARTSVLKARTQALNQIRGPVSIAPASLRERLRALSIDQLFDVCAGLRPGDSDVVDAVTKLALRTLARRGDLAGLQPIRPQNAECDSPFHTYGGVTAGSR
jgi:transposase